MLISISSCHGKAEFDRRQGKSKMSKVTYTHREHEILLCGEGGESK